MKISKKYGRRAFLGGTAALVGLPFFEALAPRKAVGATGGAPKRFLGYFYPNGIWMDDWRPVGTGANFTFGPAMGANGRVFNDGLTAYPMTEQGPGLDTVKSSIMVISGLQNTKQEPGTGDHSGGVGAFLTNRTTPRASTATSMKGPSIDYVIAKTIGQDTKRPYLGRSHGHLTTVSGIVGRL